MKPPIDGGVVMVTGASSGIGKAFVRALAPRARVLVLLARRVDRLQEIASELAPAGGAEVLVEGCDLTDRSQLDATLERVDASAGPIDVLINNAGFGSCAPFHTVGWSRLASMIELNVTVL